MVDAGRSRWIVPLALCSAVVAGCASESSTPAYSAAIDTLPGGAVRVVNTPPENETPTWWIEEELRLGSFDGDGADSFGEVRGIVPLEDGRIAVLETQTQEVRIFGPDGAHLVTYGGEGEGPGEIRMSTGMMLSPDGLLWVPDIRNARMSLFHPDSGFVESHAMRILRYGYIWGGVMTRQGGLLKPSIVLDEERTPVLRVFDSEMNLTDSLPLPRGPEIDQDDPPSSFVFRAEGRTSYRSVPFYPGSAGALDPAAVFWSTAYGDPSYRIARWAPPGDTTLVIETNRAPVPVTAAERDSAIAEIREQFPGATSPDWSKIPDVKPAVSSLFLSGEGRLWVRRPSVDGVHYFDLYDQDGRLAGSAATTLSVWPYLSPVVRGDRVWTLVTDELDIPYVVRGRLVRFECRSDNPAVAERSSVCLDQ